MPLKIGYVILARSEICICGRIQNLGSSGLRMPEVCVRILNIHGEHLSRRTENRRALNTIIRPNRSNHDQILSQRQLRMPDISPRLRNCEDLFESECRTQPANRRSCIAITQDWKNCLHALASGGNLRYFPGFLATLTIAGRSNLSLYL